MREVRKTLKEGVIHTLFRYCVTYPRHLFHITLRYLVLWCVALMCPSSNVSFWCVPLVCPSGVSLWCVQLVCPSGVSLMCPSGVFLLVSLWCVPQVCPSGVSLWCVPLECPLVCRSGESLDSPTSQVVDLAYPKAAEKHRRRMNFRMQVPSIMVKSMSLCG